MRIIALLTVTVILCTISFLLFARDRKRNLPESGLENMEKPFSKSMLIYSAVMIAITIGAAILFCTLYEDADLLASLKSLSLLCVIWPIAYIDFKTYRIPNDFIILGLICRVVILPFELMFKSDVVWMTLLSDAIAAAALLVAALLCALCIKNSIGFGDIKMFIVMGLLLGLDVIWSAIFLSLVVSFFVSIFLIATKKKNRKDVIPFGPALVIGTFLSVCLLGR